MVATAAEAGEATPEVPETSFSNGQLTLFQSFLINADEERGVLSNAVDLWDSIPRYAVSRLRMNSMRTAEGFLDVIEIPFCYRGRALTARIHPARIIDQDGKRLSYYPGAREEIIEHALRRIAAEQSAGFFDHSTFRSGVRFSLHQLRREIERQGHSLRYDQLKEGLDILSKSTIEIIATNNDGDEAFATSTYIASLAGVKRRDYEVDRSARWTVQFHPLITQAIDQVTYRQFNYHRLMQCSTALARWLLTQLVLKYTQAAPSISFDIRFSTIQRDSALLNGYTRLRDAIATLDEAMEELKTLGALSIVKKSELRGARKKIEDVSYTLYPTREFVTEQKAANRRSADAKVVPIGSRAASMGLLSDRPRPAAVSGSGSVQNLERPLNAMMDKLRRGD